MLLAQQRDASPRQSDCPPSRCRGFATLVSIFFSPFMPEENRGKRPLLTKFRLQDKCVYPSCVSHGCHGGYCSTHISLCAVGGCPGQRCPNSPFCEFHGERARNPADGLSPAPELVPTAGIHQCDGNCAEHRHSNKVYVPDSFCRTPGCSRVRQTKDGGESEWCESRKSTCTGWLGFLKQLFDKILMVLL